MVGAKKCSWGPYNSFGVRAGAVGAGENAGGAQENTGGFRENKGGFLGNSGGRRPRAGRPRMSGVPEPCAGHAEEQGDHVPVGSVNDAVEQP